MPSPTSLIKITRVNPGESISGMVTGTNFPNGAFMGQLVQIDGLKSAGAPGMVSDQMQLKYASGTTGFHLERDLILADSIPLEQLIFAPQFLSPVAMTTEGGLSVGIAGGVLVSGGTGFTSAPAVTFTGGGGTGAAATATIAAGAVTGITITNPGANYTSAPTVVFSGGGGNGAAVTATLNAGNASGWVSARRVLELEAEGPDYLLLTNGATGVITAATPIGTLLSSSNGLLYVAQNNDEPAYRLRTFLAPQMSTNTLRIGVEGLH